MADAAPMGKPGIVRQLENVFREMTEIRVVTAVGQVAVTLANEGGATKTTVTTSDAVKDALVTIIDLTDGDVVNVISPSLKDDEGLRAFHTAQVEKSLTVLPDNLRAMFDLGKVLYNELQ